MEASAQETRAGAPDRTPAVRKGTDPNARTTRSAQVMKNFLSLNDSSRLFGCSQKKRKKSLMIEKRPLYRGRVASFFFRLDALDQFFDVLVRLRHFA